MSPNGYVGFFRGAELVPLEIDPARILDRHGRNVTPKGLHWGIDQRGRARWLTLRLDDAKLPLPYTIDPAAAWRVSSTATKVTGTGTWTITTPNTILANDVLVVEQSATVNSTTYTAPTDGGGGNSWSALAAIGTTAFSQDVFYKRAVAADSNIAVTLTPPTGSVGTTVNVVTLHVFKGLASATLANAQVGGANAAARTMSCPAITTVGTGAAPEHIICLFGAAGVPSTTWTSVSRLVGL